MKKINTERKTMIKKFKWNWGWGIFLTIVVFMGIIVVIVASMMNREVDLVTDRYYDKEIKFQQQIDKEKRTAQLNEGIKVDYSGNSVRINFPGEMKPEGQLYFYRPSNLHKDFKIPISVGKDFSQLVDVTKLDRGLWKLKIDWSSNKNEYYFEKTLMLN